MVSVQPYSNTDNEDDMITLPPEHEWNTDYTALYECLAREFWVPVHPPPDKIPFYRSVTHLYVYDLMAERYAERAISVLDDPETEAYVIEEIVHNLRLDAQHFL